MLARKNNKIIDIAFDLDGVVIPEYKYHYQCYKNQKYHQHLPEPWFEYHIKKGIVIRYRGENLYYLLLPGMLEVLQYFIIKMKDSVRVSFFSAGPQERNFELVRIIKQRIARKAGVNPKDIHCRVFSYDQCIEVDENSPLHPQSSNNPHIPENSNLWGYGRRCIKKVLSSVFGADIGNVILVDNKGEVITFNEIDHHLKVPTCQLFSGADLVNYRKTLMDYAEPLKRNLEFLNEEAFYRIHLALFVLGFMTEAMIYAKRYNLSISQAVSLLQICPATNYYKSSCNIPIYDKYDVAYYYKGFLMLSKRHPKLRLFVPFPEHGMQALQLMCENKKTFVKYTLISVTNTYWPPAVYHTINQYSDEFPIDAYVSQQGMFSNSMNENKNNIKAKKEISEVIEAEAPTRTCAIL